MDRSVGERDAQRRDVRTRCAVEETSRTRGVAGDGAANGDVVLTRWVGREQQPFAGKAPFEVAEVDSGLDANR